MRRTHLLTTACRRRRAGWRRWTVASGVRPLRLMWSVEAVKPSQFLGGVTNA